VPVLDPGHAAVAAPVRARQAEVLDERLVGVLVEQEPLDLGARLDRIVLT
jgi:hypothetical protein